MTGEAMLDDRDAVDREGEAPTRGPMRLCVGCRRTVPKEDLARLALLEEAPFVVLDPRGRLGGRGASVHPSRACIELAVRKGGLARAAKRSVSIEAASLFAALAAHHVQRAESLLIAASRRKLLAIGTEAVREALRAGRIETLLVARDAEGRREELEAAAARSDRRACVFGTKESLGRLFGRDEVGVMGILDRGIGDEIVRSAGIAAEMECTQPKAAGTAEAG